MVLESQNYLGWKRPGQGHGQGHHPLDQADPSHVQPGLPGIGVFTTVKR